MRLGDRKLLLILLAIMVLTYGVTGCKGENKPVSEIKEQVIRYNVCAEPETLDPAKATGLPESTVMLQLYEGLTRYDANQSIIPGLAKNWEISPDGLTYTFKLRDAKWSNGEPVKAADFVYSWLRVLAPETASEYAYQLFYIKGAEEFNSGKGKKEDVAVKALDEKTLQVVLRAPASQFLGLTAFHIMYPVYGKSVQAGDNWYTDPAKNITTGPFKFVSWEQNQKIVLEKNPQYWDAENVQLNKLEIYLIGSLQTGVAMFKTNQLDMQNEVPLQDLAGLKGSKELVVAPDASVDYYKFNVNRKPFNDIRVRRALAIAIDRKELVDNLLQAGQKPAFGFVPFGLIEGGKKDFRELGGDLFKEDINEAKKLLAEAGFPDGRGFPKISLMYNNNPNNDLVAQAIQQMWKKNLGIEVSLQSMDWQVYLDRQSQQDFDITRTAWSPDYLDPMTFMDIFVTDGGNNNTGWSNAEYDRQIKEANSTGDQKVRVQAMHKAERILMDEMPLMPIFFYTHPVLIKENLKDVIIPSFGTYADFKYARVD